MSGRGEACPCESTRSQRCGTGDCRATSLAPTACACMCAQEGRPALPVGLQLIGRSLGEADLLHLGHVLEQTLDLQHPALPAPLA